MDLIESNDIQLHKYNTSLLGLSYIYRLLNSPSKEKGNVYLAGLIAWPSLALGPNQTVRTKFSYILFLKKKKKKGLATSLTLKIDMPASVYSLSAKNSQKLTSL